MVALSMRAHEKNLMLLEALKLETPKTKEWAEVVRALPIRKKKALYIVNDNDLNLKRASRNLKNWVEIKNTAELNAYDVLQRSKVIIDQEALPAVEKRLSGETQS